MWNGALAPSNAGTPTSPDAAEKKEIVNDLKSQFLFRFLQDAHTIAVHDECWTQGLASA